MFEKIVENKYILKKSRMRQHDERERTDDPRAASQLRPAAPPRSRGLHDSLPRRDSL
jgi:hypothetical protein